MVWARRGRPGWLTAASWGDVDNARARHARPGQGVAHIPTGLLPATRDDDDDGQVPAGPHDANRPALDRASARGDDDDRTARWVSFQATTWVSFQTKSTGGDQGVATAAPEGELAGDRGGAG